MGDEPAMADPRQAMRDLQRMADRVCVLILSSDLPAIDIEIEKNKVRERCLELYRPAGIAACSRITFCNSAFLGLLSM